MATQPTRRTLHQLQLFHARPRRPRWAELPIEIRRKALPLLASLLRVTLRADKEASDER
jgi:hypothetical protein